MVIADPEEEHAVPTATAPPPTNLPSRTDVPIKDEKKREELNLIPDEYFMANQEVYRSSNGNVRKCFPLCSTAHARTFEYGKITEYKIKLQRRYYVLLIHSTPIKRFLS